MAHYLIVRREDVPLAMRVEADSIKQAIESLDLEDGAGVLVYRIIAEPKTVSVKTETVRRVEIE